MGAGLGAQKRLLWAACCVYSDVCVSCQEWHRLGTLVPTHPGDRFQIPSSDLVSLQEHMASFCHHVPQSQRCNQCSRGAEDGKAKVRGEPTWMAHGSPILPCSSRSEPDSGLSTHGEDVGVPPMCMQPLQHLQDAEDTGLQEGQTRSQFCSQKPD